MMNKMLGFTKQLAFEKRLETVAAIAPTVNSVRQLAITSVRL
jgi:hypothetical protein